MKPSNRQPESSSAYPRIGDAGIVSDWLDGLLSKQKHCLRPSTARDDDSRENAKERRKREFTLGRLCAESQLALFGENRPVEANPDRSPKWPNGFVGSISHSEDWTWAVVARNTDFHSIGIDTEQFIPRNVHAEIHADVLVAEEWHATQFTGLCDQARFTVAFSAKEALYKCCYPLGQEYFGFDQAFITHASTEFVTLQIAETNPVKDRLPFDRLTVFFKVCGHDVFTLTWLENRNNK